MIVIQSPRLQLSEFQMTDAPEVFACITPAISKFMPWEPPSWSEYVARCEKRAQAPEPNQFSFAIRRRDNNECLGMASFEHADSVSPEVGLWLKETAHRQGFGREVVAALVKWGHTTLGKESFIYSGRTSERVSPAGDIAEGVFTARLIAATARTQNMTPSFTGFPSANREIVLTPIEPRFLGLRQLF